MFHDQSASLLSVGNSTISPDTQATFELQYDHSRDPSPFGIPVLGNRPADLPRERNLGEPFSERKSDDVLFSFDWSHAFNDRWTLRHRFYGDWLEASENVLAPLFLDSDGRTLNRLFITDAFANETYATSLDITGKFDTWGLRHTLLSGVDYFKSSGEIDPFIFRSFPSIDIFNPTHGGEIGLDPSADFFSPQSRKSNGTDSIYRTRLSCLTISICLPGSATTTQRHAVSLTFFLRPISRPRIVARSPNQRMNP